VRTWLPGVSERADINTHFHLEGGHQSVGGTGPWHEGNYVHYEYLGTEKDTKKEDVYNHKLDLWIKQGVPDPMLSGDMTGADVLPQKHGG